MNSMVHATKMMELWLGPAPIAFSCLGPKKLMDFYGSRYIGWSNISRYGILSLQNPKMATRCYASFFVMRDS